MSKKLKVYGVNVKVIVDTTVDIKAESYEDAITKSREIKVKDVVEFDSDYNDGSIAILGIWNHSEESK